ncbi:MAG: DUF177 domain-containing protein [Paracoccaceae bacterium]
MTEAPPTRFRTGALSHRKPTRFRLAPDAQGRADLAASLDLQAITALSFQGEIVPKGREDFALTARLTADVVQACVVTLAPVPARIDEEVTRRYLAEYDQPEGEEVEMPEDDSAEPLPEVIDLTEVLREALALALPLYPRAPGAELAETVFAEPGVTPIRDEDLRPFAALSQLQKKLEDGGG